MTTNSTFIEVIDHSGNKRYVQISQITEFYFSGGQGHISIVGRENALLISDEEYQDFYKKISYCIK